MTDEFLKGLGLTDEQARAVLMQSEADAATMNAQGELEAFLNGKRFAGDYIRRCVARDLSEAKASEPNASYDELYRRIVGDDAGITLAVPSAVMGGMGDTHYARGLSGVEREFIKRNPGIKF